MGGLEGLVDVDIWILTILSLTIVGLVLVSLGVWMVWRLYLIQLRHWDERHPTKLEGDDKK